MWFIKSELFVNNKWQYSNDKITLNFRLNKKIKFYNNNESGLLRQDYRWDVALSRKICQQNIKERSNGIIQTLPFEKKFLGKNLKAEYKEKLFFLEFSKYLELTLPWHNVPWW